MKEKARARVVVSGRVQGVFFRQNTQQKAKELGITGWVKNLPDGQVEAIFEGDKEKVEKMVKWAEKGPDSARVDSFNVEWQEYRGEFENFEMRY